MPEAIKTYIAGSDLFNSLPADFYAAQAALDRTPADILAALLRDVPQTSTFHKYLTWVETQSLPRKTGIVDADQISEVIPPEFLNKTQDFDLYVAINYIKTHPEDKRWEDI
jgi:hypothetical protein